MIVHAGTSKHRETHGKFSYQFHLWIIWFWFGARSNTSRFGLVACFKCVINTNFYNLGFSYQSNYPRVFFFLRNLSINYSGSRCFLPFQNYWSAWKVYYFVISEKNRSFKEFHNFLVPMVMLSSMHDKLVTLIRMTANYFTNIRTMTIFYSDKFNDTPLTI